MALRERLELYRQVEAKRKRPLIVYVTSNRVNASGLIASDSVAEVLDQLQRLPPGTTELDFLIVSDGGDPTVAWRIVSLIRERAANFSALVPQAAYSAATLIVLGADEVVMHREFAREFFTQRPGIFEAHDLGGELVAVHATNEVHEQRLGTTNWHAGDEKHRAQRSVIFS